MVYIDKHVSRAAAALSYFLTLSVFPLLICISGMLGSLHISDQGLLAVLGGVIPRDALELIRSYLADLNGNTSVWLLVVGLIVTLTTASAALRTVISTMKDIQGRSRFNNLFGVLFSFVLCILLLIVIYLSAFVMMAGSWFLNMIYEHFGYNWIMEVWRWLRFVLLFVLLAILIQGIYMISAPKGKPRVKRMTGALAASFLLVGVSILFSWFINMSVRYTLIYGSLASIIILMIWIYICGNIVIMGNVFNVIRHKYRNQQIPVQVPAEEQGPREG